MIARVRWWEVAAALGLFLVLFAAISLPRIEGGPARRSACIMSMRQTGYALIQYASDADERLPISSRWDDVAQPYARGQVAFRCPAVAAYGYAFNRSLSARLSGTVGEPGTTPMTYDSTDLVRNAADRVTSLPSPGRHANSEGTRLNTIGYVDGHAKMRAP